MRLPQIIFCRLKKMADTSTTPSVEPPDTLVESTPQNTTQAPKQRSMLQQDALARARVRAQEVRAQNAAMRQKEKAIVQAEKQQRAEEINRKYEEVTKPKEVTKAKTEETTPEPEVEEEVVKKKKGKRRVVVVEASDSDDDVTEVVLPKPKNRAPRRPPNPFDRPFIPSIIPF